MANNMVNVRLSNKTITILKDIERTKDMRGRGSAITYCVRFTKEIMGLEKTGCKLILEHKNGKQEKLIII